MARFDFTFPRTPHNIYASKGKEFESVVRAVVNDNLHDTTPILECLDRISIPHGFRLFLYIARAKGMGDESYFFLAPEETSLNDVQEHAPWEKDLLRLLEVEPSEMGAWQAHLLFTSPCILPTFWHGGYIQREYIYSYVTLRDVIPPEVENIQEKLKGLVNENLLPSVSKSGNTFNVSCVSWSQWGGLMRDKVGLPLSQNGQARFPSCRFSSSSTPLV